MSSRSFGVSTLPSRSACAQRSRSCAFETMRPAPVPCQAARPLAQRGRLAPLGLPARGGEARRAAARRRARCAPCPRARGTPCGRTSRSPCPRAARGSRPAGRSRCSSSGIPRRARQPSGCARMSRTTASRVASSGRSASSRRPARWESSWSSVIAALSGGTFGSSSPRRSSRWTRPFDTSRSVAAAVNVLVIEPSPKIVSRVTGALVRRSASPIERSRTTAPSSSTRSCPAKPKASSRSA